MLLRRVTITGFKSFANKTVIELEPGITAVVGPNGSGKSNLADAIRWALGEQTKGRLRLTERDEVVFAGSDKRARASFAEVILLFDNEDGAFPLDLTEVEIGRRLYRSGETDYRLAGRSVRYADIQALLAQAGVGAGSYAVIGQGMIDSILMSSPAERKLLFDEAAGIRGPELGRESAQRKLTATATNLTRLRDIAAELAPQLASLERSVGSAQDQAELEAKVRQLRTNVVSARHAHWAAEHAAANEALNQAKASAHRLRHEQRRLRALQHRHQAAEERAEAQRELLRLGIGRLEQARDQAATEAAEAEASANRLGQIAATVASSKHQLEAISAELETAKERCGDLRVEHKTNAEAATRAAKAVERTGREVATAQEALVALREGSTDGVRDQYLDHALQILKTLAIGLAGQDLAPEQVRLLVHKAGRLLSHATRSGADELLDSLQAAQKHLEAAMGKRETAIEHQTNVSITGRSLDIDLAHQEDEVARLIEYRQERAVAYAAAIKAEQDFRRAEAVKIAATRTLAELSEKLQASRKRIAALTLGRGPIPDQTSHIIKLERATTALAAAMATQAQAHSQKHIARTNLRAAAAQAQAWGVKITAGISDIDFSQRADQLARAETMLQARTQAHAEEITRFTEVANRHSELTTQIADLEAAEADLRQLINRLDSLIRERFQANFAQLAEHFNRYFAQLFGGGQASLELAESPDGAYGINIKASPQGKRLASIAALSGGERALAGVALVAAILRVNPAPFVMLDEVDAALDEANSGRLADILTELQAYSQLVVITHNRQTMKAARVLFGVTMNEHHVSHILSMRLEEATQLAAR